MKTTEIKSKPDSTAGQPQSGSLHSACSAYWVLFEHMSQEHGLTLLDSELEDICQTVDRMRESWEAEKVRRYCRTCYGSGQVEIQSGPYFRKCKECGGTGQNA